MSDGPVISESLYSYATDRLNREVKNQCRKELSQADRNLSSWVTEQIRAAYTRGLADGFSQGVAKKHDAEEA